MQVRLRAKKIGYKKEFLREISQKISVRENDVRLTCKLPMTVRIPRSDSKKPQKEEFFTLYHLVEAVRQCKEPLCTVSFCLP